MYLLLMPFGSSAAVAQARLQHPEVQLRWGGKRTKWDSQYVVTAI